VTMSVENGVSSSSRRGATPPGGPTTFDLFSWSEGPDLTRSPATPVRRHTAINDSNAFQSVAGADQTTACDSPVGRPTIRMQQPAGGISHITFGEQLSAEEAEALLKRRPGSDLKKREMYGSGIFTGVDSDINGGIPPVDRTSVRCYQPAGGVSQISFGGEECASPKKPVTVPEVAKQKELSGTVETTDDLAARRVVSNAKAKELIGSNIFGPPPPEPPKPSRALELKREEAAKGSSGGEAQPPARNVHTSVKVSNPAGGHSQISFGPKDESDSAARKLHDQKKLELSGHDIFSDENALASEKNLHHHLSQAKLKELSGSDIFSDDKPAGRDLVGGIRKPPGGGSTISLQ
jgi:hypothetical protein